MLEIRLDGAGGGSMRTNAQPVSELPTASQTELCCWEDTYRNKDSTEKRRIVIESITQTEEQRSRVRLYPLHT